MGLTRTDRRARPAQSPRHGSQPISPSRFSPPRPPAISVASSSSRKPARSKSSISPSDQVLATPFLDVSSQILTDGERGLLGLAFDPNFASNGFFYVDLINTSGDTEIRRYHVSSNPNIADPASATPIITIDQAIASNHKGGWIGFGPDGYLYAALGDGGGGGDPRQRAEHQQPARQDAADRRAWRRLSRRSQRATMRCPPTIRSSERPGADEIFALGLRNPWRPSFDRALGDFYIADVGQNQWEEIDLGQIGANYGWNVFEGPAACSGRNAHRRLGGRADLLLRPHRRAVDHRRLRLSRRRGSAAGAVFLRRLRRKARSSRCASTAPRGSPPNGPLRSCPMSAR